MPTAIQHAIIVHNWIKSMIRQNVLQVDRNRRNRLTASSPGYPFTLAVLQQRMMMSIPAICVQNSLTFCTVILSHFRSLQWLWPLTVWPQKCFSSTYSCRAYDISSALWQKNRKKISEQVRISVMMCIWCTYVWSCLITQKPNTHRRRWRDSTAESSRVGGVYWIRD